MQAGHGPKFDFDLCKTGPEKPTEYHFGFVTLNVTNLVSLDLK